jgi:hypothetical protein
MFRLRVGGTATGQVVQLAAHSGSNVQTSK